MASAIIPPPVSRPKKVLKEILKWAKVGLRIISVFKKISVVDKLGRAVDEVDGALPSKKGPGHEK